MASTQFLVKALKEWLYNNKFSQLAKMFQEKARVSQPSETSLGSLLKESQCFIYLDLSGCTVYSLFSFYIEFFPHHDSQDKATKNLTAYLILNVTAVA